MQIKNARYILWISILLLLIFYSAFHAFFAERSFKNINKLHSEIAVNQQKLFYIQTQINELENKISLITNDDNPDLDYLDELIRLKLGKIPEKEFVIFY